MTGPDYPAVFRVSDAASLRSQNTYLWLQRLYLGSLVIGSMVSALVPLAGAHSRSLFGAAAIILVVGLITLWGSRAQRYDTAWFDCRAVAESAKTATWRYMMRTPPFDADASVDSKFVSELTEIREARPGIGKHLAQQLDARASEITDLMQQVRSQSLKDRKALYLDGRLRDQKSWYSIKARAHARAASRWFWSALLLQVLAVVVAVAQTATGGLGINLVPFIATCGAAIAAWNQTKHHDELAQSYWLAAQELGALEAVSESVKAESDFAQLVEQTEEAISREHTLWCARRDMLLSGSTGGGVRQRNVP